MTAPIHDCLYCGKKMTNGEECRKHAQSECDDWPVWAYPCMYCGLQFPTELGLIIPTARWCKEKPTKLFCGIYLCLNEILSNNCREKNGFIFSFLFYKDKQAVQGIFSLDSLNFFSELFMEFLLISKSQTNM